MRRVFSNINSILTLFIAELQRPEGLPSGAPYSYRIDKETHELIFSRLSWLAVLLMGVYGVAQHGGYTSNYRLTETCSLGTSLILHIHVIINWHLSNQGVRWPVSHDHIAGPRLQLIEVACFLFFFKLTKCWFSIVSRAHMCINCWKQGRIVRKPPVNATSGLKANQVKAFYSIQMSFAALFCVYIRVYSDY